MDYKEFIEAIVAIEREFDVNALRCGEIEMWPLIRSSLHMGLLMKAAPGEIARPHSSPSGLVKDRAAELVNFFSYGKNASDLEQHGPVDFLFLSRASDHADIINGKTFERYIDPLIDTVRDKYTFFKLELSEGRSSSLPRHEKTYFLNPKFFLSRRTIRARGEKTIAHIPGFGDLQKRIMEYKLKMYFEKENLIRLAQNLGWWTVFYEEVMERIRPKAVFLVYYPGQQAMVRACKKLGIRTVDIQHGYLAEYHPMYTHWTRIPEKGYRQLPNFFWLWDEKSFNYIAGSRRNDSQQHIPVVGGNRWLSYWKRHSNEIQPQDGPARDFMAHLSKFGKRILVACGGFESLSDSIPEHVETAMRNAPSDWIWLIRLHHSQKHRKAEVFSYFKELGIGNFEVEQSTVLPLFTLLEKATDLVTACSSVCCEALAFGVPSTIVHPLGLQFYVDFIAKGTFSYASDKEAFLDCIRCSDAGKLGEEEHTHIETSDLKADLALKRILDFH